MKIPGRIVGYQRLTYDGLGNGLDAPNATLEVALLVPLPNNYATRNVTLVIDPTPGEAAYLRRQDFLFDTARGAPWDQLRPEERAQWEDIANAARKAKP